MTVLAWVGVYFVAAFLIAPLVGRRLRRQQPTNRPPKTPWGPR